MKEIRRGYVKWEENGVFHKEPLYKFPDLLEKATDVQKAQAEEVRLMEVPENVVEEPVVEDKVYGGYR